NGKRRPTQKFRTVGCEPKVDGTSFLVVNFCVGRLFPFGSEAFLFVRREIRPIGRFAHLMKCPGPDAAIEFDGRGIVGVEKLGAAFHWPAAATDVDSDRLAWPKIEVAVLEIVAARIFPPGNPGVAGSDAVKDVTASGIGGGGGVVNGAKS